ncbi:hypothetical protein G647_01575 [Cladophialophora carrionii CBS 160.54]|uniref:Uncharacterized protein n=1 Tax=Cladophialophora carrionii CBS 160.54 TaxID=1279043 RepID=V9DT21_9EURO|nr:uncharacterized protein G647_01575 [Cladophialophora carrionii CBS 160.54]ETI29122.1 hypothetical protein G647_01575 [Cladophialophora carrionii CBS 160.54]
MAYWHDRPATGARSPRPPRFRQIALLYLVLTAFASVTSALQSVPGSPCESVCSDAGTLENDVVCLDANYQSLSSGRGFQKCVACQLNSTAVDTVNNNTDVEYGLLALRYTLAGCMFAIPEDHISISSPCQVSCAPLNNSVGYQVTNDSSRTEPGGEFCTAAQFDDTTINKCAQCYSFIPQQLFLANFLQALHIACRDPPEPGRPFFPDAQAIFNETLIAGPAPPSSGTNDNGGLRGYKLALAIALPIVGGILLIGGLCWGCFAFTRKRRYKMAQSGRMSRVHDAHADGNSLYQSPMSAKAEAWKKESIPWGVVEPAREMHAISPTLLHAGKHSPGAAQGRWSHQTGGTGANSEQNTPLRSSFQRDDVGPGPAQVKDPNLHEQYFGVSGDSEDERAEHGHGVPFPGTSGVGVAIGGEEGYYPHTEGQYAYAQEYRPEYGQGHGHGQHRLHDDERGQFI